MAMHPLVLLHLQEWNIVRRDLRFDTEPPYDYWLLHVRRGFFRQAETYLFNRVPERVFSFRGVPFFCIYSQNEAGELAKLQDKSSETNSKPEK